MNLFDSPEKVRVTAFFSWLLILALGEIAVPRRALKESKGRRWFGNLGILVVDIVAARVILPTTAIGVAAWAETERVGIFHHLDLSPTFIFVASIVLLDFIIWAQHVMFHAVPMLWRLHLTHHADHDFDVTTGFRFHPIEIIISLLIKFAAISLIGPPVAAVLAFELALNLLPMFNHSNIRLPGWLDGVLRLFVVTPDVHRIHHSELPNETNSNFGFNIPWWDRLFGTYIAQPRQGHTEMKIGLENLPSPETGTLLWQLTAPFKNLTGHYPLNRRRWD